MADDTDDLYAAYRERNKPENVSRAMQDWIAPTEHCQFMEETTALNPIQGTAALMFAPAYTAAKSLGLIKARSSGSIQELGEAFKGYGRGVKRFISPGRAQTSTLTPTGDSSLGQGWGMALRRF